MAIISITVWSKRIDIESMPNSEFHASHANGMLKRYSALHCLEMAESIEKVISRNPNLKVWVSLIQGSLTCK